MPDGGTLWWNEGYWHMLDAIRAGMPKDGILTTECNGEPFVRWFDGYLTWHWQFDGQVPAFPAIYGGAVQMFGRAYRGGASVDLALRMKAGQQLVFGEQIGWLNPRFIDDEANGEFLRRMVWLRYRLRRYFYAGDGMGAAVVREFIARSISCISSRCRRDTDRFGRSSVPCAAPGR